MAFVFGGGDTAEMGWRRWFWAAAVVAGGGEDDEATKVEEEDEEEGDEVGNKGRYIGH